MNKPADIPTIINTPFAGGFYSGRILLPNGPHAVITAPKAEGEFKSVILMKSLKRVDGALSYFDGLANTRALAEAGSKLAADVLALTINGFSDWQIPARDALELQYRNHKPGKDKNYTYRSGENPSSIPAGYPYTNASPGQVTDELFREGGAESFELEWYWSSTQYEPYGDCAWYQDFGYGYQYYGHKDYKWWARAVRVIPI